MQHAIHLTQGLPIRQVFVSYDQQVDTQRLGWRLIAMTNVTSIAKANFFINAVNTTHASAFCDDVRTD